MAKKAAKKKSVKKPATRRRRSAGVPVDDIPSINLSQIRSSVHPVAGDTRPPMKEATRTVRVRRGDTVILKII